MGFKAKPKGIRLICPVEVIEPDEGKEPLTVVIKKLTLGELRAIPQSEKDTRFEEVCEWIAPYVLSWNVEGGLVDIDGEECGLRAAPADEGPDQFFDLDPLIPAWIYQELRKVHIGGEDLPKEPRHSNATPAPANGDGSASPQAGATSRRSQPTTT